MAEYKLKTGTVGEVVVGTFRKIEDSVVGTHKKIENGVVGAYKKIEDGFVDRFLEEVETESEINTAEAEATDRAE